MGMGLLVVPGGLMIYITRLIYIYISGVCMSSQFRVCLKTGKNFSIINNP